MALLEVKDLRTSFFTDAGEVKAVNGVSFDIYISSKLCCDPLSKKATHYLCQ